MAESVTLARKAAANEWVKVTRVHYAPHAKIAAHDHTETGAAYVYLNDSGPVIFNHINLSEWMRSFIASAAK